MKIFSFLALSAVICITLSGCATKNTTKTSGTETLASTSAAPAAPLPPQGMYLGNSYISALNEPCYELFSANAPAETPQVLCLREGTWTFVPPVHMDVPNPLPVSARP